MKQRMATHFACMQQHALQIKVVAKHKIDNSLTLFTKEVTVAVLKS